MFCNVTLQEKGFSIEKQTGKLRVYSLFKLMKPLASNNKPTSKHFQKSADFINKEKSFFRFYC